MVANKKQHGVFAAIRNDGALFFAPDRILLNEFLDSSCDCTLGYFCERHEYLNGGAFHDKRSRARTCYVNALTDDYTDAHIAYSQDQRDYLEKEESQFQKNMISWVEAHA